MYAHVCTLTHKGDVNFRASCFFPCRIVSHALSLSWFTLSFQLPVSRLSSRKWPLFLDQVENGTESEMRRGGLEPWWMWLFSCRDFLRLFFLCCQRLSASLFLKDLFIKIKQLRRRGKEKAGLNNLFFIGTKKCFSFSPRESRVGMNESDLYISSVSDHLSGQSNTTEMTFHLFAWPVTAFHLYSHLL